MVMEDWLKGRERIEERKMSKQPLPAPTASAIGPCPTIFQFVGRLGTGSLSRTIATPDHPCLLGKNPVKLKGFKRC